jgi:hypothetical protein
MRYGMRCGRPTSNLFADRSSSIIIIFPSGTFICKDETCEFTMKSLGVVTKDSADPYAEVQHEMVTVAK